jgi:hypothetical protein
MAARYTHDYAAFDRLVLAAPWMQANMLERAERVYAYAVAHAPYDPEDVDGTHYRDSFEVSSGVRETPTRRAYGRVSNTDMPTALFVEYGSRNNPRHRTLGASLGAAKD